MAPPATPRDAATVILIRSPLEVYLLRRPDASSFMGGAWVFPGGKVDPSDGDGDSGIRAAAVRELSEECGVRTDPAALLPWARWVTPDVEPRRFDARFFVAVLPEGCEPRRDPSETTDAAWLGPRDALERNSRGLLRLMPPTLRNVELLAAFVSVEEVVAAARTSETVAVEPVLKTIDGRITIVLPGDPLHHDRVRRVAGPTRIVFTEAGFQSMEPW